jgi:phosphatidylcholine synthase
VTVIEADAASAGSAAPEGPGAPRPVTWWQRAGAGAVHVYTACGSAIALLVVLAALDGEPVLALWLLLAALVLDGTDGMLARGLKVKERVPWFDGARLDDIVDYLTYAFAPMLLLLVDGRLPAGPAGTAVAVVPLLASSFQFCRVDAKTDDHLFLGFPSYWNVVAFYAIVLDLGPATVTAVLLVCSVLVVVPVGYLYPSRTTTLRPLNLALTAVWLGTYAVLLVQMPDPHPAVVAVSFGYLGYYLAMSIYLTLRREAQRRAVSPGTPPVTAPGPGGDGAALAARRSAPPAGPRR